ncbi:hypothetical protein KUW09_16945 [Mameliella alba]|nr:hypothetical protein [Antarctobacter heliothermus]MBY6145745.1 hypothetical protein [Mameliella alba]MCA0954838.1 hypothetical protein [Mameliella alba]
MLQPTSRSKAMPLAALLALWPLVSTAQHNSAERMETGGPCPGAAQAIALAPAGFLGLDGSVAHLTFGPALHVCLTGDSVAVHDSASRTLPCKAIRDSADEGIGHAFTAEGIAHHLWFHIPPEDPAPTLEVGLYREDEELVWIDTGFAICTG